MEVTASKKKKKKRVKVAAKENDSEYRRNPD